MDLLIIISISTASVYLSGCETFIASARRKLRYKIKVRLCNIIKRSRLSSRILHLSINVIRPLASLLGSQSVSGPGTLNGPAITVPVASFVGPYGYHEGIGKVAVPSNPKERAITR